VENFYLVYGYACLYSSLKKVDITDLTLTFIESRHPRTLLAHLQEVRGYDVEEKWPGIYIIKGDILPMQIINSRKLSEEENLWLKGLDNRLGALQLHRISREADQQRNAERLKAYLDVITRANKESFEEVVKMSDGTLTIKKILKEAGWIDEWETEGKAKVAVNMLKNGFSVEQVVNLTELDIEKVKSLTVSQPV
jgi:hypothetical protein